MRVIDELERYKNIITNQKAITQNQYKILKNQYNQYQENKAQRKMLAEILLTQREYKKIILSQRASQNLRGLPIKTEQEFGLWETKLTNQKGRAEFSAYVQSHAQANISKFVTTVIRNIFDSGFSSSIRMTTKVNGTSFGESNIVKLIIGM